MTVPRRRLFSFSLRTLLIGVTLVCLWLGWEAYVVRQRKAMMLDMKARLYVEFTTAAEFESRFGPAGAPVPVARVSTLRRWLGDEAIQEIGVVSLVVPEPDQARLRRWFPEARVDPVRPLEPCHPGCFPTGTLVATVQGVRAIETIRIGDELVVFDRLGQRRSVPVTSVFTTTNRLVEIETERGTVLTTTTQPLAASFSRQVAAGELAPGDQVLVESAERPLSVKVVRVTKTERITRVYNLVLRDSELFIAGGFLARSKPPAAEVGGQ